VLVGGGYLAKSYFAKKQTTKKEQDTFKNSAINHNKDLDAVLAKKDEKAYGEHLYKKASRFQPKIPYRIDNAPEVLKRVKQQMEAVSGSTSIISKSEELYREGVLVVTYNYMTDSKLGDKFVEGSGKVTRVWAYIDNVWKLVHEHISEN